MRLVLDTNVWIDWLVFDDPAIAPLKAAVAQGRAAVFIDDAVQAELARVLAYPFRKRTLDARAQAEALSQCLRIARRDEGGGSPQSQKSEGRSQSKPAKNERRETSHFLDGKSEGRSQNEGRLAAQALLPKCSDPDDQKFLELALACGATALLTHDEALLELGRSRSRPLPFRIVTPQALNGMADGEWWMADGPTSSRKSEGESRK